MFEDGNHGTMIVTTQLHSVVSTIRATVTHILHPLSDLDCWSLFQNYAFNKEIKANSAFMDVGREISRRCGGIPLIVKALANLLCNKANMDDWVGVMEGNLWDVLGDRSSVNSFILSYQFLSPIAKRCFIYFSVFHNYSMKKETLINLWMVEGCVEQKEGEECFQELVSKSIIQQYPDGSFTMHKVFIELARNLAGDFAFVLKDDNKQQVSNRLRHFSYPIDKTVIVAQLVVSWKDNRSRLRTFLLVKATNSNEIDPDFGFLDSLCSNCKHLLVLSMSSYTTFSALPNNISKLKHLCYLDLSHTKIETLPDSVTSLYCLQTLLLFECRKLAELPMNMKNLVNLLYLDVRNTGLRAMPPGFGNLKHLQVLTNFVVGTSGSLISELRELSDLRGKLSISELQNVVDPIDASHASLNDKKHVTELIFQWTAGNSASENESYVLENFQPCENLEKLSIENFRGTRLPSWLGNSKFNRMELMHISDCNFCSNLPPLGQLPYLKTLILERMEGIKVVGPEFYGNALDSTTSFRSLMSLKFIGMLNLEVWQVVDGKEHFPFLEELEVSGCPNLKNLPDHLNSVSALKISGCTKLMILPSSMMSLKYLDITGCAVISAFSFDIFPLLEEAQIRHFEALLSLWVKHHSFLQKLCIEDCPLLCKIKLQAPHLKKLSIFNCENLELMPKEMNRFLPSLEQLDVRGCSSLKALDKGRLPSSLDEVRISDCDQLIPQADWGLDLTSATSFAIEGGSTGETSFPVEGLLPASLLALHISRLKNLKCLYHKGLKHLTSLKMIGIHQCENLEDISKKLPTSLSSLMITECPLLATHVRERSQEVLDKISHIDLVTIDDLTFGKGKLLQSGEVQQDIGTST